LALRNIADPQLARLHGVPDGKRRQAPAPSHVPSNPHVAMATAGQNVVPAVAPTTAIAGMPAGTDVHAPSLPLSAHDWHPPLQATEQHTPCAQWVESQSPSTAHWVPSAFLPQIPVCAPPSPVIIIMQGEPLSQSSAD
jgi:hypothetical protein